MGLGDAVRERRHLDSERGSAAMASYLAGWGCKYLTGSETSPALAGSLH